MSEGSFLVKVAAALTVARTVFYAGCLFEAKTGAVRDLLLERGFRVAPGAMLVEMDRDDLS